MAEAGEMHESQGRMVLGEAACRYRAGEVRPEDLPMIAAEALAAGLDGPTLRDLAGWPRQAGSQEIREAFERALDECGVGLPEPGLARRHGLRRVAARLVGGELAPFDLAADDWWETEVETVEEREFVRLIPQCSCCLPYTLGLDERTWAARLRAAALALVASESADPCSGQS